MSPASLQDICQHPPERTNDLQWGRIDGGGWRNGSLRRMLPRGRYIWPASPTRIVAEVIAMDVSVGAAARHSMVYVGGAWVQACCSLEECGTQCHRSDTLKKIDIRLHFPRVHAWLAAVSTAFIPHMRACMHYKRLLPLPLPVHACQAALTAELHCIYIYIYMYI